MRENEVWLSTSRSFVEYDHLADEPNPSARRPAKRIIIIGGGASGTLEAIRLLREPNVDVILIERSGRFGRGLAYGTENEEHVPNVPPMRLSAHEGQPAHFWDWLVAEGRVAADQDRFVFLPRRWYGDYLEATLEAAGRGAVGRLTLVQDEVVGLSLSDEHVIVELARGRPVTGDICILATGHDATATNERHENPSSLPLLILGSGLSMIDHFLTHIGDGPVVAISRHGLMPRPHLAASQLRFSAGELPIGAEVSTVLRWLRRQTHVHRCWRAVVDGLRPHTQKIWQAWSPAQQERFLRHARSFWDVHRHRASPHIFTRVQSALAGGELSCVAAVLLTAQPGAGRQTVAFRRRGSTMIETLEVRDVIDCRGMVRNWASRPHSLVHRLIHKGVARRDSNGLGLDVTTAAQTIGLGGAVNERLFAIGPLGRGTLFEIEAIPEIRAQCDSLALALSRQSEDQHHAAARS